MGGALYGAGILFPKKSSEETSFSPIQDCKMSAEEKQKMIQKDLETVNFEKQFIKNNEKLKLKCLENKDLKFEEQNPISEITCIDGNFQGWEKLSKCVSKSCDI